MAEQQDREQMPKKDEDIRGFDMDEDFEDVDELDEEEQTDGEEETE